MPGISALLHSIRDQLDPTLIVLAIIMFGAWTVAYVQIITHAFRHRTYGLPLPSIFTNIAWEFLFAFNVVAPLIPVLYWGNRLWFAVDCVIVATVFLYGRERQTNPWVREHFYSIAVVSILGSVVGLYAFCTYFNDVYGLAASFLMNFSMIIMFIALLFKRPDLKGLPYGAAWGKMIGTVAGAAFCYHWWPMQFDANGTLVRPPFVKQPPNAFLLYFLYVTIPLIDCLYIYLHRRRQKALADETAVGRGQPQPAYQLTVT